MPLINDEQNIFMRIGHEGVFAISSERIRNGKIQWDSDDHVEFKITGSDQRVHALLHAAADAKQKFSGLPTNLREERTCKYVMDALVEQYGEYNYESDSKAETLHRDAWRQNTNDVARIDEFQKNELICRHRAALLSLALQDAGVENCYVQGYMTDDVSNDNSGYHAWVVSRKTGAVFDASADPHRAYRKNISCTTLEQIVAGENTVVITPDADRALYGSGYCNVNHQAAVEQRSKGNASHYLERPHLTSLHNYAREQIKIYEQAWERDRADFAKALEDSDFETIERYTPHIRMCQPPNLSFNVSLNKAVARGDLKVAQWLDENGFLLKDQVTAESHAVAMAKGAEFSAITAKYIKPVDLSQQETKVESSNLLLTIPESPATTPQGLPRMQAGQRKR